MGLKDSKELEKEGIRMRLIKADIDNSDQLYLYWNELGREIPYFFHVKKEVFLRCLFHDSLNGEEIFKYLETYYVEDQGEIVGFIQFGKPNFQWDTKGQKTTNVDIGVIRNIYFNRDREEVGEALIEKAKDYFKKENFSVVHAFYHIMGMSCNANHGKLHQKRLYIENLLLKEDFEVEHQNIYYTIDMRTDFSQQRTRGQSNNIELRPNEINQFNKQQFQLFDGDIEVGRAALTYIENSKTVYLNWIGMKAGHSGVGIGSIFMEKLFQYLLDQDYHFMHTDTADNNLIAQRYYEKNGFENRGFTRSYLRKGYGSLEV